MRVAPVRLRLRAGLIDAAAILLCSALGVGMGTLVVVRSARLRSYLRQRQQGRSEVHATSREFRTSPKFRAAMWGVTVGIAVTGRNWRSPGFRLVGLRRVDAKTNGRVSVRSALVGVLFDEAWKLAVRPVFRSRTRREQDRVSALRPKLKAIERENANDPQALQRALTDFYDANDVNFLAGCGWQLVGPVVAQLLLALGIRGGRTVRDRITGTEVIVDPGQ